jgi:TRAP-type mannitol/chloroaromatic compound transport system substrate-binding protein
MQRRSFIRKTGLAGVLAAGAAPAIVNAQAAVKWRPRVELSEVARHHLRRVRGLRQEGERHDRRKVLGRDARERRADAGLGVVDGVQQGTVEVAHTAPYYFFGKDPVFGLGCAIPFGLNSRQMTAWMYEGNGLKLMREFYAQYGFINLPGGNTGAQMGGWFRKEMKSVADFKGLKFRIGGFGGKIIERIGGVPQNIPASDIYPALEKGTIDAAEWVGPYDDLKLGLNKIASNYYYPGWWEGGPQLDFFINQKAWDALSADYKAIVEAAASHAHVTMQARYDAVNPQALKTLVGSGAKLHRFPKDMMDQSFKAAMDIYGELNASNPAWKKIYADFSAWRRDANLWFRFTEAGFDDFMQAQKL